MPVYDYSCGTCNFQFERKQRFHEEPVAMCPKCQEKARRVINAVPIIFKGSGFYVTDNRQASTDTASMPKKNKEKPSDKVEDK